MERFEEKFKEAIDKWPEVIDVSDGQLIGDSAFFSGKLWNLHLEIEAGLPEEDVWLDMMSWSIYNVVHNKAIENIKNGTYEVEPGKIVLNEYKKCLLKNLINADDYYWDIISTNNKY